MIEWTGQSNGHLLVVKMDKDAILASIQSDIDHWEQSKAELDAVTDEVERETLELDERYERCRVNTWGSEEEYMTIDECIQDLKSFKQIAEEFSEKGADEVLALCARKKNGTFKRNTRPTIAHLNHGTLYEEAYGWSTTQLRIRPETDTEAVVELDRTVIKW